MSKIKFIFLLCFICFPLYAEQLIIEPDSGRAPVLQVIQQANHQLNLVMYGFTDKELLNAIKKQNYKSLKIILEKKPYKSENENIKTIQALKENNISWQGNIPGIQLIHQKTLMIDAKKAMIMTFNFTNSTFKNQRNFALMIDNPEDVSEINNAFIADWNHIAPIHKDPHLIWSPGESREKFLNLINHAKNTINIYSQTISDYEIIGALAKAARLGVNVTVLTSSLPRKNKLNYLAKAGVKFFRSSFYIHAKVIVFDNNKAIIGSTNLTRASFEDNRELSVITTDGAIIKQLNQVFKQDLARSAPINF